MIEHLQRHFVGAREGGLAGEDRAKIIAVGETPIWKETVGETPAQDGISYVQIEDLNATLISLLVPGLILSPMVAKRFDCLDVAATLSATGFTGSYRAVTRRVPNPSIVRREVHALFPELDFDIMLVGKNGFYVS